MKAKFLTAVLILAALCVIADKSYAHNQEPVADLEAVPVCVLIGDSVTLDGSASYDPDGSIVECKWDWTSDLIYDYTETPGDKKAKYTYPSLGTYTATLQVKDNGGATDTNSCTIYVDRIVNITQDSNHPTIQAAIDAASPGDTIVVAEGTYTDVNNRDLDFSNGLPPGQTRAITVRSIDPNDPAVVAATIIDCNGTSDEPHRGFYFHNGENNNSVLDGFTITNGSGTDGGGIYCYHSSPTVTNCIFRGNSAGGSFGMGGGMHNEDSSPIVTNCIFRDNTAVAWGGGMWNYNSSPKVTGCFFEKNNANFGGGMYNGSSSPTVVNCVFSENYAGVAGGGMCNYDNPATKLVNCIFSENHANSAGGGLSNNAFSSPTVVNCTFSRNSTDNEGGGIENYEFSNPYIINCILWGNQAPTDPEITNFNSNPTVTYCDIDQDGYEGDGNIRQDPKFVDAEDLNGSDDVFGTMDDGLCLRTDSPCIDEGSNSAIDVTGVTTDIIGNPRKIDGDHNDTVIVDMGAYELPPIWYVDADVQDGNDDGTSWTNAYDDLQDALTDPNIKDGNEIWVADCTYEPTEDSNRAISFELVEGVGVYGGFSGGETARIDRDWTLYETILSGDINNTPNDQNDNSYHVVIGADRAALDGFTITGGNAAHYGGGIYCSQASPTIRNCTIEGNNAPEGGGMYNYLCSPIVTNCFFSGNYASVGNGGGMYNFACSALITNCTFSGNEAPRNGGGMHNLGIVSPTLINCTFSGNVAHYGGGMYNSVVSPTVTNCIFWGNEAVWDGNEIYGLNSNPIFSYCDIKGCGGSDNWDTSFGTDGGGNIDADPYFVDANNPAGPDGIFGTLDDGLQLKGDSPCIDAADGNAAPATDILGHGRIDIYIVANNGTGDPNYVDVGAYENQWSGYLSFGMEVNSVTGDSNEITVTTTGATYVLSRTGMDMYRRIDPNTNAADPCNEGKGRWVATLAFSENIGPLTIESNDVNEVTIQSTKATFDFQSDSLFFVTAKESFTYDHNNLIDNAPWNAPLDPNDRDLDRMWTDGYGGSLHANVSGSAVAGPNDVNYTTISMSEGDIMAHMAFPPKRFDFEGLYGENARPFVHFLYRGGQVSNVLDPNTDPNMNSLKEDGFGVFTLFSGMYTNTSTPVLLDFGVMGYEFKDPNLVKSFINSAHQNGFKVIAYLAHPSSSGWNGQDVAVTLQFMREFQGEHDFDGWYFDNADTGDLMDDYNFIRQVRTDIGEQGIIYHHDSVDIWSMTGGNYSTGYKGLRAIMINAYVNYTLTGETGTIAEVDYPNDPYFRFYTAGYGMSQAYSAHKRKSNMKVAISQEEKQRVMGENLNGCERVRSSSWLNYFKPAYDKRKAEYLNDPNNFDPDVNWPIDGDPVTGGWFRTPGFDPCDSNDLSWDSNSATIHWTTPEIADSEVTYTSTGYWWEYKEHGPDGIVYDANMVIEHSITLSNLQPDTYYEYRIRSNNGDANIPGEVIWGYVDDFNTP